MNTMAMEGDLATIVVLALGAGLLGGPDALSLLLNFAGKSPLVDVAISVFLIAAVTTQVLGTMLLSRRLRKARTGAGEAATDRFAQMTLMVALAVVFLVAASLLVVPFDGTGGLGPLHFLLAFGAKSPLVAVAVFIIGAATAPVLDNVPLARFFRNAYNASGAAPAVPATGRFPKATLMLSLTVVALVAVCPLIVPSVAAGGFDAQRLFLGLAGQSSLVNLSVRVGVAIATVASTTLIARLFCKAHSAAEADSAAPPTPAMEHFGSMVVVMKPVASHRPLTIVLSMGAGALGGPDALRLLLTLAGQSPLADIAVAVFVIAAVTAPVLGTMLLARFFRKARTGAGAGGGTPGAAAADRFAEMTLVVSLGVAVFIAACLLVIPSVAPGRAPDGAKLACSV